MFSMIRDFDERISAWLDDAEETGLPTGTGFDGGYLRRPSDASLAVDRASEEADSHDTCPPDGRTQAVLVRVVGVDYVNTVVSVPAGRNLSCVIGALNQDDTVIGYQVLGYEPDVEDLDNPANDEVTEAGGIRVTSQVPGLVASWDAWEPYLSRRQRIALVLGAAALTLSLVIAGIRRRT